MTELISSRRSFLAGLGVALIAAPAIVRAGSIMPVKQMLILPDKIGDITPPISGYASLVDPCHTHGRFTFENCHWNGLVDPTHSHSIVPPDANERWERMKARELKRMIIS